MNKIAIKMYFVLFLSCYFIVDLHAQGDQKVFGVEDFPELLTKAGALPLLKEYDPSAVFSTRKRFTSQNSLEPEGGISEGLRLWVQDQRDFLLLEWFREETRAKRMLICALFVCERFEQGRPFVGAEPVDFWIDSKRFSKDEALERSEEVRFVIANASRLALQFSQIFKEVLPNEETQRFVATAGLSETRLKEALDEVMRR